MRSGTIAFAVGVALLAQLPALPDPFLVELLPPCGLLAALCPRARLPALLALGFLWALLRAHLLLGAALPVSLEGRDLVVEGVVRGLPASDARRTRFDFEVTRTRPAGFAGRVRMSWYEGAPALVPGERWSLTVRLKRPRGLRNPGGFDYEGWLFLRGVTATGYVRARGASRRLAPPRGEIVSRLRQHLAARLAEHLDGHRAAGVVAALAIGARDGISPQQWRTLRATGTSHLLAISGLHVGLVAGFAFLVARRLWSLAGTPAAWVAAPRVGALAALAAGVAYAGLAGFSVPTQRALVMLAVAMLGVLTARRLAPGNALAVALLAVLALDPFAVLSPGTWLSFAAVAVILIGMTGRPAALVGRARAAALWWRWGRVQVLVAVGLLPVTLAFFLEHSWVAPLANLLAVPWTTFTLVPAVLAGTGLMLPFPALGGALLELAALLATVLFAGLERLADADPVLRAAGAPWTAAIAGGVGVLLLIAPRGTPARWVGLLWLAPLLFWPVPRPEAGAVRVALLDVGQGLAVVVRTRHHALVYDAGPRFSERFDAGAAAVVPYLRHDGVRRVDLLVISHRHADHTGGTASVLRGVAVSRVLTNVRAWRDRASPCRAGLRWRWDGVAFEVLHPSGAHAGTGNEGSCVLAITSDAGRVLLTGDIGRDTETALVARYGERLQAQVLLVPHHGSRESATGAFLDAVRPRVALLTAGHRNRFGFPHPAVLERLASRRIALLETAREGAVVVALGGRRGLRVVRRERRHAPRFWHAPTGDDTCPAWLCR